MTDDQTPTGTTEPAEDPAAPGVEPDPPHRWGDGDAVTSWITAAHNSGLTLPDLAAGITAMAEAVEHARVMGLPTVYEALARVKGDLPGIGKLRDSPQGYKYRSIEDITASLRAIEARHGVMVVPTIDSVDVEPSSGNWTDTTIRVTWSISGPRGDRYLIPHPDDPHRLVPPQTYGIGHDNADKGVPKALTMAYKGLLLVLYTVGDENDDAERADVSGSPGVAAGRARRSGGQAPPAGQAPAADRRISEQVWRELTGRAKALPADQLQALREQWTAEDPVTGESMFPVDEEGKPAFRLVTEAILPGVRSMLTRLEKAAKAAAEDPAPPAQSAAPGPPGPESGGSAGESAQGHTEAVEEEPAGYTPGPVAQALEQAADAAPASLGARVALAYRHIAREVSLMPAQELPDAIRAQGVDDPDSLVPDGSNVDDRVRAHRAALLTLRADSAGLPPYEAVFDERNVVKALADDADGTIDAAITAWEAEREAGLADVARETQAAAAEAAGDDSTDHPG